MRLNKFIAQSTGLSRRAADVAIGSERIKINDQPATLGHVLGANEKVSMDGTNLKLPASNRMIMFHKPVGYVVSRQGQGSKTIYDLLPPEFHALKPIGRLDKDSSGLLLLTDDGDLANEMTHPSFQKQKVYEVGLNKTLSENHRKQIGQGIELADGISRLELKGSDADWVVTMHEGRKRQIRRTFEALGYKVIKLHRIQFGNYRLGNLPEGKVGELT